MLSALLIFAGILFNGIGTGGYFLETLRGRVKPNKVTFFIWSLAPLMTFFAQVSKGVGIQSLMTLSVGIFPLSIFAASFLNKKAYWKLQGYDIFCGLLSVAGLLLWIYTNEPNTALVLGLCSEALATFPTVIKAYFHPQTEQAWPWFASALSGSLTLVTIRTWNFQTVSFPLLYTIEMVLIFACVHFQLRRKKHTST